MTPHDFIKKWSGTKLKERAAAHEHFLDLCRLLEEQSPAEADPSGLDYGFEKGATKTTGGKGFADVFKRGCFGWEYKGTHANLDTAFAQLQRYAVALDNPPLLIVSDIGTTIRIHTNWTNSVSKIYEIPIADIADADKRGWLKSAFTDPEALRPKKTRQELTEEIAGEFAALAKSLRERGHLPEEVAHFINRLVFCMFAEDVNLLPSKLFTRMIERALDEPAEFESFARDLFLAMKDGGRVGFDKIAWFNGGLFNDDLVFPLTKDELKIVHRAAIQYWGDIDPSILGTLFERGLDPDKRSQLGAHYTDRDKIMMIIGPTIVEPLAAEWSEAKGRIEGLMAKAEAAKGGARTKAKNQAQTVLDEYLKRLADYRVLDPACGSGNFLYVALRELKNLEHRAQVESEALGLPRGFPQIGPEVVRGIEINPYAAELARVSVWIGEIQWMLKNGFNASSNPVLKPLETIECRDALLSEDGDGNIVEAQWPKADAIIGNPPFLGDKVMVGELGEKYTGCVRSIYSGKIPGGADLVVYWIWKGFHSIQKYSTERVGFVATNSVRNGASRKVLDQVVDEIRLIAAWSDEPWTVEGASVRVSLIVFGKADHKNIATLNGKPVKKINSDLTSSKFDLTKREKLEQNKRISYVGVIYNGPFFVAPELARDWLLQPRNVDGSQNSEVLRPSMNGDDFNGNRPDRWVIDFGPKRDEQSAALFQEPFSYSERNIKSYRQRLDDNGNFVVRTASDRDRWWIHSRSRGAMRKALEALDHYIATPMVTSYRNFGFLHKAILPDQKLVIFVRDDFAFFGILESRFHFVWTVATCSWIGSGNDITYSNTSVFETFPFPEGLTPDIPAGDYAENPHAIAIGKAAALLNERRENWLNPPDLVRREPEVVEGFPDRILPVDEKAAAILKKRTLTNLYNERPAWLVNAHRALDEAVAGAYGWPADLSDDEILARLFALNQERAAKEQAG